MSDNLEINNQADAPVKKKRVRKKAAPSGIKGKFPSGLPTGRPSLYTESLAEKICDLVASSIESMEKICAENPELPEERTIRLWRFRRPEFAEMFLQAKEAQAHLFAESIDKESQNISTYIDKEANIRYDSAHVAAKKLLTDNRRWIAQNLANRHYNAKQIVDLQSSNAEKDEEIRKLREQLNAKYKQDY